MNSKIEHQCSRQAFHHFVLTRFNLLIFNKDKEGHQVRSASWLEHRFELFERYCFPSLKNQTCQNFEWIVLFDSSTPECFKEKIERCKEEFPQLIPVYVRPEGGRFFAQIFRDEVVKRISSKKNQNDNEKRRVLTTYLDNDDALDIHFVEDIQRRSADLSDGTFITYDNGYQYFTDYNYVMSIRYPRNHFISVVENVNPLSVKTIYGYGSHYYIDKIKGVRIEHVKNLPMCCEVIHEKNMGNDAYFLRAKMMKGENLLLIAYGLNEKVYSGVGLYLFRFLPRYVKTFVRRIGYRVFGRHW